MFDVTTSPAVSFWLMSWPMTGLRWAPGNPLFLMRCKSQKKGVVYVMSKASIWPRQPPMIGRQYVRGHQQIEPESPLAEKTPDSLSYGRMAHSFDVPWCVTVSESLWQYVRTSESIPLPRPIVTAVVAPLFMSGRDELPLASSVSALWISSSLMTS
jgi:hypothetical protein